MKRNHAISFLIILVVESLFFTQQALGSDVLRYEDDQGRLILVDSPSKIPQRYRSRVESVPTGKQAEELNTELTKLILGGGSSNDVNRSFDRYLFLNRWTLILFSLLILTFLMPVFFRNPLSRLNIFVSFLILLLIFHLVVFVPKIQNRVYEFSGIVRHMKGISLPVELEIRHKVLSYRIHSQELPLIPVNIYAQLLELRKLQQLFQVRK